MHAILSQCDSSVKRLALHPSPSNHHPLSAAQGTDVKLSGHFVYASVSDMSEYAPLRCTNRCVITAPRQQLLDPWGYSTAAMQPLLYLLICLLVTTCAATCCMRNRVHSCSRTLAAARSAASNSITVLCAPCRQKVLEWLGQLGALDLAEDHEVTLPQLAPHQWQQLHSNSPMLMKPKLDRSVQTWGPRGCC